MAELTFDDYGSLKDAIGQWLAREDLVDSIPAFIALCEAKLRRKLRNATTQQTVAISNERFVLPAQCGELRALRIVAMAPPQFPPIPIVTPEVLAEHRARNVTAARPRYASVLQGANQQSLLLAPTPDQTYNLELTYYLQVPSLTEQNPVNWVLQTAPDVYLYGALVAAEPFLENDTRVPLWKGFYEEAMSELKVARERAEYGASLRPMRLPVVFGGR